MMTKEQETAQTKTETEPTVVIIERGEDGCYAAPKSFHVDRGGKVIFKNETGDRIVLVFFKGDPKNDPFEEPPGSNGARVIEKDSQEEWTVRGKAEEGSYTYRISGPGCQKPSGIDVFETSDVDGEYQVKISYLMAKKSTDPTMIVD